jgi:kynurenine formamidase
MNQEFKIIDLTHTLTPSISTFDGGSDFELAIDTDYKDCTPPNLFRTQKIKCGAGIGTHMDAPAHAIPGAETIEALEIENLVTDCVVIDVSNEADENYVIMPETVEKFEKEFGEIKANTFVIFYTGWDKYWTKPEKYRNNYKFPSVHESTAQMLLKRNIAGLGIDTLSADTGKNGFPVHRAILGAGKYLVENVTNLKELPAVGVKSLVLPMKIKDATEAPIRLIALV